MSKIHSVFISDSHLGSKFAQTKFLLQFMKWVDDQRPKNFYIVGDFIDGWKLQKNWYWTRECNLIIRKVFSLLKHDTNVFYAAGNHDEFLRCFLEDFNGVNFAGLEIADEFIHESPNGQKTLIIHGDKFDTAIRFAMKHAKFMCKLGDWGYDFLIYLNGFVNKVRRWFGMPYFSLSKLIKHQFKDAVKYIGGFEQILVDYAKEKDCTNVVCGHIHTAADKMIDGIRYLNCGDWVESNTALVEYEDGTIVLFDFEELITKKSETSFEELIQNLDEETESIDDIVDIMAA